MVVTNAPERPTSEILNLQIAKDIEEKVKILLDNNSRVMSIEIPKENVDNQYLEKDIPPKVIFKLIEGRNLKNTDIVERLIHMLLRNIKILSIERKLFTMTLIQNGTLQLNLKWQIIQMICLK